MKLKNIILVLITASVILLASASPAMAFKMPSISGDYQLIATSPSDDPSTGQIEVKPGEDITVQATAVLAYQGIPIVSPPITVCSRLQLLKGNSEIASESQTTRIDPFQLEDGKTYTRSGSGTITVPSGLEAGSYKLDCSATAKAGTLFRSYSRSAEKSYTITVLETPKQNTGNNGSSDTGKTGNIKIKKFYREP